MKYQLLATLYANLYICTYIKTLMEPNLIYIKKYTLNVFQKYSEGVLCNRYRAMVPKVFWFVGQKDLLPIFTALREPPNFCISNFCNFIKFKCILTFSERNSLNIAPYHQKILVA